MPLDQNWWERSLTAFQQEIGYIFADGKTLQEALTHASFAHELGLPFWNERLEFLGDAVLQLCTSELLFTEHPDWDEGRLTQERSRLVCENALAKLSFFLKIPPLLRLGRGLDRQGGRENPSLCADALEAVFGAVFLDGGFEAARPFVRQVLLRYRTLEGEETIDPKTRLLQLCQERGGNRPEYETVSVEGTSHAPQFVVAITWDGEALGRGAGSSKKEAEIAAARKALEWILRKKQGPFSPD